MALNPARIGHRYPAYRYEVSREKVREYARATGASEAQVPGETGDAVALPTFAASFTIPRGFSWAADPELGAHPALVHGEQSYVFHRPVRVGDVLVCTPQIDDIRSLGRNEFLTAVVECVDEVTGEPVVTSKATIIFFSRPAEADATAGADPVTGAGPATAVADEEVSS